MALPHRSPPRTDIGPVRRCKQVYAADTLTYNKRQVRDLNIFIGQFLTLIDMGKCERFYYWLRYTEFAVQCPYFKCYFKR